MILLINDRELKKSTADRTKKSKMIVPVRCFNCGKVFYCFSSLLQVLILNFLIYILICSSQLFLWKILMVFLESFYDYVNFRWLGRDKWQSYLNLLLTDNVHERYFISLIFFFWRNFVNLIFLFSSSLVLNVLWEFNWIRRFDLTNLRVLCMKIKPTLCFLVIVKIPFKRNFN